MVKKWNEETMKEYVEITSNSGYKFIKLLENETDNRIIVRCDKGHEYEVRFYNFKTGYRCPYCAKSEAGSYHKFNIEDIKKYVLENTNCKLISTEYVNARTKLEFECSCGNRFKTTFDIFKNKNKRQCTKCTYKLVDDKDIIKREIILDKISKLNCKLLSDDLKITDNSLLKFECSCGTIFESFWRTFKNSIGKCKKCTRNHIANRQKHSYEYVKNYIENFGYRLLSEKYILSNSKLEIQCEEGHKYKVTFAKFSQGQRCPICSMSNLEIMVKEALVKNNIDFISEHTYEDLIYINKLRFDFYLPKYNTVIEAMGRQHEEEVEYFGGKEGLEKTKIRDAIKKDYCVEKNIKYIAIWHYDYKNIETILTKELKIGAEDG